MSPAGHARNDGAIYELEILQTPKIIAISSEFNLGTRRIWMDEKAHPPADELDETFVGTRLAAGRATCSWSIR